MLNSDCIVQYVLSTRRDQAFHNHGFEGFVPRINDSFVFKHKGVTRTFRVMDIIIEPFVRVVVVVSQSSTNKPPLLPMLETKVQIEEVDSSTQSKAVDINMMRNRVRCLAPGQKVVFNVVDILGSQDLNSLIELLETQGFDTRVISGRLTVTRLLLEE